MSSGNNVQGSSQPQDLRVEQLRQQVNEVKNVMAQNVEAIMERGDRLDNIERRTEELHANSESFKMTARRVERKMCMMNAKWTFISVVAGLVGLLIVIIIILSACGVFDKGSN